MEVEVQTFVTVCIGCLYIYIYMCVCVCVYHCLIDENCNKTLHCRVFILDI